MRFLKRCLCNPDSRRSTARKFTISCSLTFLFALADIGLGVYDAFFHPEEDKDCSRKIEDKTVAYLVLGNGVIFLFFGVLSYRYAKRLIADSYNEVSVNGPAIFSRSATSSLQPLEEEEEEELTPSPYSPLPTPPKG